MSQTVTDYRGHRPNPFVCHISYLIACTLVGLILNKIIRPTGIQTAVYMARKCIHTVGTVLQFIELAIPKAKQRNILKNNYQKNYQQQFYQTKLLNCYSLTLATCLTLSANFRWKGRRPPITVGVRKLEWLSFPVVSKYLQCVVTPPGRGNNSALWTWAMHRWIAQVHSALLLYTPSWQGVTHVTE